MLEFLKALLVQLVFFAVFMGCAFMVVIAPIVWKDWGWLLMIPGIPITMVALGFYFDWSEK